MLSYTRCKMITFKETPHDVDKDGIQRVYTFEDGTILSAVKTDFSYGGEMDKWEIAVLDDEGNFITQHIWNDLYDDVIGWVTDGQLEKYVEDVDHYVKDV